MQSQEHSKEFPYSYPIDLTVAYTHFFHTEIFHCKFCISYHLSPKYMGNFYIAIILLPYLAKIAYNLLIFCNAPYSYLQLSL
jgi:hypothetical protein